MSETAEQEQIKIMQREIVELFSRTNTLIELLARLNQLDTNMRERMLRVEEKLSVS